jgi:mono/diheme cytochrome c family protein
MLHAHARLLLTCLLVAVAVAGCQNMQVQPKLAEPYDASPLFGRAARDILPEAVAVGHLNTDEHLYEGLVNAELATTFPFEITREILERGQQQYEAFCTPCHGYAGYGDGIIAQEGMPQPASFHTDAYRETPVGHYYQVITYGFGVMYDYAARIETEDRWAIVAYIRALQYSQNAAYADLPAEVQAEIDAAGT